MINIRNININNTFKARKTILEMLKDRNYKIDDKFNINIEEYKTLYDNINLYIPKNTEDDGYRKNDIYIYFDLENKNLGKAKFKEIVANIHKVYSNDIHIIIVLYNKINNIIYRELENINYKNIEIFLYKNLYYNLTKHFLVPKHIVLNEEEEKEVLEKYNATKKQLPKILMKDPIVKYYNCKRGQIFKIIRKNKYVGEIVSYRVVIKVEELD